MIQIRISDIPDSLTTVNKFYLLNNRDYFFLFYNFLEYSIWMFYSWILYTVLLYKGRHILSIISSGIMETKIIIKQSTFYIHTYA